MSDSDDDDDDDDPGRNMMDHFDDGIVPNMPPPLPKRMQGKWDLRAVYSLCRFALRRYGVRPRLLTAVVSHRSRQETEFFCDVYDILRNLHIRHPLALALLGVVKGQRDEYGFGMTSLLALIGKLCLEYERLSSTWRTSPSIYIQELETSEISVRKILADGAVSLSHILQQQQQQLEEKETTSISESSSSLLRHGKTKEKKKGGEKNHVLYSTSSSSSPPSLPSSSPLSALSPSPQSSRTKIISAHSSSPSSSSSSSFPSQKYSTLPTQDLKQQQQQHNHLLEIPEDVKWFFEDDNNDTDADAFISQNKQACAELSPSTHSLPPPSFSSSSSSSTGIGIEGRRIDTKEGGEDARRALMITSRESKEEAASNDDNDKSSMIENTSATAAAAAPV
mmetsp:Transcript_29761/g.50440  ORF Transcript_29761/g.50440 Transcript_29761/m.50440 type:complete len:393 (-) Transcript_29761:180-1358(-)